MNVKEYIFEKRWMLIAGGACLLIAGVLEFLLFPSVYRLGILLITILLALFITAIAVVDELRSRTAKQELILQDLKALTEELGYRVPEGGTQEEQELAAGINNLSRWMESLHRENEQDRKELAEYIQVWTPKLEENLKEFRVIAKSALRSDLPGLLERQVDQTNLVVQQLLYYLRTKTDGINSRKVPVSLNDIALQTIKRYYPMMQEKRIGHLIKGQDVIIHTDPDILSFAFGQILHNAIKYSPRKSSIGIYIKHFRGNYYLMVEDKGMGINPSDQAHVFDKSYVGKNEADESSPGMGLYLAKSFIELLGYEIGLTSKLNHGTTVAICFTGEEAYPGNAASKKQLRTSAANAAAGQPEPPESETQTSPVSLSQQQDTRQKSVGEERPVEYRKAAVPEPAEERLERRPESPSMTSKEKAGQRKGKKSIREDEFALEEVSEVREEEISTEIERFVPKKQRKAEKVAAPEERVDLVQ